MKAITEEQAYDSENSAVANTVDGMVAKASPAGPVDDVAWSDEDGIEVTDAASASHGSSMDSEEDLERICSEELAKVSEHASSLMSLGNGTGEAEDRRPSLTQQQPLPPVVTPGTGMRFEDTTRNGSIRTKAPNTSNTSNAAPCPYEKTCSVAEECRSNAGRCGLMPTRHAESYYGYVETVEDAVMIVEACRFGRLLRVKRRLLEKERQAIRSGSVFVFVERESGIRRWTDGKVWSPSRICGEFLIYRELESRQPPPNRKPQPTQINWTEQVAKIIAAKRAAAAKLSVDSATEEGTEGDETTVAEAEEPVAKVPKISDAAVDSAVASIRMALAASTAAQAAAASSSASASTSGENGQPSAAGSGGRAMVFKRDGLIKKTISLTVADETYHLICYFKDSNLGSELLHLTPSRMNAFKNLDVCRNPVSYPIMMLQPGQGINGGTTNPLPPPSHQQLHHQQQPQVFYQPSNGAHISGRIVTNGQYIAIPQAYLAQFMPQQQQPPPPPQLYSQYPMMQQPQGHGRKLAPQQQQMAIPASIANGSNCLPPMNINPDNAPSKAGISSILADSLSSNSSIDLENIETSCSGACNGCPGTKACSKSQPEPPLPAAHDKKEGCLEEEQLLFCHFLESIRSNEQ